MTKAPMTNLILELFIEGGRNRELANRAGDGLRILVARLAPHIVLDVSVLNATDIRRHRFPWAALSATCHITPRLHPAGKPSL